LPPATDLVGPFNALADGPVSLPYNDLITENAFRHSVTYHNCMFFTLQNDGGVWPLGLPVVKLLWSVLGDIYDIRVETIYNQNGWIAIGTSNSSSVGMPGGDIFVSWFDVVNSFEPVLTRMHATIHAAPSFVISGNYPGASAGIPDSNNQLYAFSFQIPVIEWTGPHNLLIAMRATGVNSSVDQSQVLLNNTFFGLMHQARLVTPDFNFDDTSTSCTAPPQPTTGGSTSTTSTTSTATTAATTTATTATTATTTGTATTTTNNNIGSSGSGSSNFNSGSPTNVNSAMSVSLSVGVAWLVLVAGVALQFVC